MKNNVLRASIARCCSATSSTSSPTATVFVLPCRRIPADTLWLARRQSSAKEEGRFSELCYGLYPVAMGVGEKTAWKRPRRPILARKKENGCWGLHKLYPNRRQDGRRSKIP